MVSSSIIKRLVAEAGFELCGVIRATPYPEERNHINRWLESGWGSDVGYISNNLDLRLDSSMIVDGAKSVIVCGLNYNREGSRVDGDRAKIARYAQMRDYHKTIRKALKTILSSLKLSYPQINGRVFTDSAPLLEKRMAVEAGLGWIGRQSLLVNPEYGSYILLGEIVITEEVNAYDTPMLNVGCGSCRGCIDNCPTGAIGEERTIDTRKCISCQTIEIDGRDGGYHGWIFGCDRCIESCPYSRQTPYSTNPITARVLTPPTREEWLSMDSEEFDRLTAGTAIRRSSLSRIVNILRKDTLS
ncbi:MAG: tRNA epoxyqueuosine(34) reductase QueG [Rikenellaceae bacterium]